MSLKENDRFGCSICIFENVFSHPPVEKLSSFPYIFYFITSEKKSYTEKSDHICGYVIFIRYNSVISWSKWNKLAWGRLYVFASTSQKVDFGCMIYILGIEIICFLNFLLHLMNYLSVWRINAMRIVFIVIQWKIKAYKTIVTLNSCLNWQLIVSWEDYQLEGALSIPSLILLRLFLQ